MNFPLLPPEVLSNIFEHVKCRQTLLSCALTCRLSAHLTLPHLWNSIVLEGCQGIEEQVKNLAKILNGNSTIPPSLNTSRQQMKRKNSDVVARQEDFARISGSSFHKESQFNANLAASRNSLLNEAQSWSQNQLKQPRGSAVSSHYPTFLPYARHVKILKLFCQTSLPYSLESSITRIFRALKRATHVELDNIDALTDDGVKCLMNSCKDTLTFLKLAHCGRITDAGVRYIAYNAHNLTHLDLSYCILVSDHGLSELSKGACQNLQSLNLRENRYITDIGILALASTLKSLELLVIDGCRQIHGYALTELACKNPSLRYLSVDDISNFTDDQMLRITQNCQGLRQISVEKCFLLSDFSLIYLVDNCTNLESINFTFGNLSEVGINHLSKKPLTNLKEVYFGKCLRIPPYAFKSFFASHPTLHNIYLSGCSQINDDCIKCLVENCKNLEILSIPGTLITDLTIYEACKLFKTLKIAQFSFCNELTPDAIGYLAYQCPKLEVLQLLGCQKITNSYIMKFSRECPVSLRDRFANGYCAIRPPRIRELASFWFQQQKKLQFISPSSPTFCLQ